MNIVVVLILAYLLCISNNKVLHHIAILVLCLLFASRNTAIPDTLNYIDIYETNVASNDSIEIGYLYLCKIFQSLGFSFNQYLFCIIWICLELIYKYTCVLLKNRYIGIALIMLISYFGLYYYGIVLRSSIAITLCYCGIANAVIRQTRTSKIILFVLIIVSSTIHISSLLFLVTFIAFHRIPKPLLLTVICVTVFLLTTTAVIPVSQYIESITIAINANRLTRYASMLETSDGASLLSWTYILISLVAVKYRDVIKNDNDKMIYNCFLNLYICGSLINSLFWQIPGGSRLSMQLLFFEFIIIYFIVFRVDLMRRYNNQLLVVSLYVIIKAFALFHYTPSLLLY